MRERGDCVFCDGIGELGAVEITPVENVVVDVEGFVCAACVVVAGAAAFIAEDGVGEGDFLEFGVGKLFI